jgi:hypothetical protein
VSDEPEPPGIASLHACPAYLRVIAGGFDETSTDAVIVREGLALPPERANLADFYWRLAAEHGDPDQVATKLRAMRDLAVRAERDRRRLPSDRQTGLAVEKAQSDYLAGSRWRDDFARRGPPIDATELRVNLWRMSFFGDGRSIVARTVERIISGD